ncbi:MAG: TlpA disulfide reductase family protein [Limnohabitans sp.]|nr:TlpA disulfide reductase family protein [Limnohabitans sp.]
MSTTRPSGKQAIRQKWIWRFPMQSWSLGRSWLDAGLMLCGWTRVLVACCATMVIASCVRPVARPTASDRISLQSTSGQAGRLTAEAERAAAMARVEALRSELAALEQLLADSTLDAATRATLEGESARLRGEIERAPIESAAQPPGASETPAGSLEGPSASRSGATGSPSKEKLAPELVVTLGGGATERIDFDLSKQGGRPVVIQFFATWSGPCKATLPMLAKLTDELRGQADVVLIRLMTKNEASGAAGASGQASALTTAKETLVKSDAAALVPRVAVDFDRSIVARWGVEAVPTIFLVAPDGTVAQKWQGAGEDTYAEIRRAVGALSPRPVPAPAAPGSEVQ